ncbi:MAG: zinc-dependent alcohol dehydrogenase family protein [Ramlibacter sp.]
MQAWIADPATRHLERVSRAVPVPAAHELLLRVRACGVCRTDLHVVDGDLPAHRPAVVPGHEVVGEVVALGPQAGRFRTGDRVGVPWLGGTCGACEFCRADRENLCDRPSFTGYDRDGGFADCCVADERYCVALPDRYDDVHAAPLLCAGLIGFRAWRMAGGASARRLGLWGFGAAAHLVCQVAVAHGQEVHAFTRQGDAGSQDFARRLGACWAGSSGDAPPGPLDASLLFAPVGELVPAALAVTRKGGVVVCGGIHMTRIPAFDYALLWGERQVRSVANLTRRDANDFMALAARLDLQVHARPYPLERADAALADLRAGKLDGAAVLVPGQA